MKNTSVSIYYLSNAGLYIDNGTTGILIDGLYSDYEGLDSMPAEIEQKIMNRETPFENLRILLFTHRHTDHFSKDKMEQFRILHPDCVTYCPEYDTDIDLSAFPDVHLERIASRHLLNRDGVLLPHDTFILTVSQEVIFISGDADPVKLNRTMSEELKAKLTGHIDLLFCHPFFTAFTLGRRFLRELDPDQCYIYHMPILAEDVLRYHETLRRGMEKLEEGEVTPLLEFMKRVQ